MISDEGSGESPFAKLFSWQGTKDYGAFLSLLAAKQWRSSLGPEAAIRGYLHDQATAGGDLLAAAWHTATLVPTGRTGDPNNCQHDCQRPVLRH